MVLLRHRAAGGGQVGRSTEEGVHSRRGTGFGAVGRLTWTYGATIALRRNDDLQAAGGAGTRGGGRSGGDSSMSAAAVTRRHEGSWLAGVGCWLAAGDNVTMVRHDAQADDIPKRDQP